jgi:4-hydroxy-tetrahydrodipicolinate synthase
VLLVCGAAGDFTVLSVEERLRIAEAVLDEAAGKIGVIVGAQSTSLCEAVAIARGAARLGATAIQVSPPYYHAHTEPDIYEFIVATSEAADLGLVLYTTFWQCKTSLELIGRLAELPNLVGLKWAAPNIVEFEKGLRLFSKRLCVIDNQFPFVLSHILGARGINTHPTNYWPEWGVRLWGLLEAGKYRDAQEECSRALAPYYELAAEIEKFTGGEGHLDRLCLELIGLDSSRSRPPMRDIRPAFREKARKMLQTCGVPRCKEPGQRPL